MGKMNIIQVATGMIPIPPNGWGAVERVIWEYKQKLELLGHNVDIQFINQLENTPNTIVHTHIQNLALECRDKGIPYVYSLHDHHAEWYGKDSWVYKMNLEAIKGSIVSFTHAEYLVDYFSDTDKLFYLPHGVNTDFFTPSQEIPKEHKLLMLANNGLAGNSGFDRKGFRYGVEAARELNLPITIVGSDNNLEFFKAHEDLLTYEKLNIVADNPSDENTRKLYQEHTIFLHPSMLEAGHPNLTLLEASSTCLPIVGTYRGSKPIVGLFRINEITTENVVMGIKDAIENYEETKQAMINIRLAYDWKYVCQKLEKFYHFALKVNEEYDSNKTKELYIKSYNETIHHV